jgi:hypothetical protein
VTVLRVVDRRVDDRRRVTVSWLDGGSLSHEAVVSLPGDGVESEKVRWYLEDYAEVPAEPAPVIARDAEALLGSVGRQQFERVFAEPGAAKVWAQAEADLADTRVEIDTDPSDVPGVPWELLRDPDSDQAVALGAAQFVRTHHETARAVRLPEPTTEPLRVLLVISRPGGRDDLPFRSVASRLVRSGVELDDVPGALGYYQRPSATGKASATPTAPGRPASTSRCSSSTVTAQARPALRPRRLDQLPAGRPGAAPVVSRAEALIRDSERRLAAAPS